MDIAELSIVMNQSSVQQSAGIQLAKMTMDTEKETSVQMTEIMKNSAVHPNLGHHLDVSV